MSTGLYRWSPTAVSERCKGNTEGRLGRERNDRAVARRVEAFKSLNRSKRKVNTVQSVLEAWRDTGVLVPVTTDPDQGEILKDVGQNQTPAPRKRVEI